MALSRVTSGSGVSTGLSFNSGYATGNLIVILALNSLTATVPTTPSGYTSLTSAQQSANGCAMAVFYKVAASGSETFPTLTNAITAAYAIYAGQAATPFVQTAGQSSSGSSATISYSGIVSFQNPGADWVLTFGTGNTNVGNIGSHPPTSNTLVTEFSDTTDDVAIFDTNTPVSTYSFNSKTLSAATVWMTKTTELVAASGGTLHTQSLSASFSGSGVLTKQYQNGGYQATFSTSGTLNRFLSRLLSAGFSGTGGLQKTIGVVLPVASFSSSGMISKATVQQLSGTYSTSGVLSEIIGFTQALTATFSTNGVLIHRSLTRNLSATYSTAGSLLKRISRGLMASFSTNGVLVRATNKAPFTAQYSASGTVTTLIGFTQALSATYSTSGALVDRAVTRSLVASYVASGALTDFLKRSLTATYSTSGVLSKTPAVPLGGTYQTSGNLSVVAAFFQTFAATYSATGTLTKQTARLITASYKGTGALISRMVAKLLNATFSDSGVLTSSHTGGHSQLFTATFSTAGSIINRAIGQSLGSMYVSTGNLNKSTTRKLPAASFIGSGVLVGSRGLYQSLSGTYKASGILVRTAGKNLTANFMALGVLISSIKPGPLKPPTHWANADIKNDSQWTHTPRPQTGWQNADNKNDTPWKQIG